MPLGGVSLLAHPKDSGSACGCSHTDTRRVSFVFREMAPLELGLPAWHHLVASTALLRGVPKDFTPAQFLSTRDAAVCVSSTHAVPLPAACPCWPAPPPPPSWEARHRELKTWIWDRLKTALLPSMAYTRSLHTWSSFSTTLYQDWLEKKVTHCLSVLTMTPLWFILLTPGEEES